ISSRTTNNGLIRLFKSTATPNGSASNSDQKRISICLPASPRPPNGWHSDKISNLCWRTRSTRFTNSLVTIARLRRGGHTSPPHDGFIVIEQGFRQYCSSREIYRWKHRRVRRFSD